MDPSPYAITLAELEGSAHVSPDDQVEVVGDAPGDGPLREELAALLRMLRLAG